MKLKQAQTIIADAIKSSEELDTKMNIAVVDEGGNLVAFSKMDDAWMGSIDIAIKKARTSVMFQMSSGVIGTLSQPGGPLYNIEHSNGGLITFPGGLPIMKDGKMIGGIGVSGSTVENDLEVAQCAVEKYK